MKRPGFGEALLALAAIGWLVVLLIASRDVFPVGGFICHQRPARSFFLHGQQMAVCARCTGIYVGAAVAAPIALFVAVAASAARARWAILIGALPTAVTWILEFASLAHFSNVARFIAGMPLGFAAAWLVMAVFRASPPADSGSRSHKDTKAI